LACWRDLEPGMGRAFSRRAHRSVPRLLFSSYTTTRPGDWFIAASMKPARLRALHDQAPMAVKPVAAGECEAEIRPGRAHRIDWARLLKRVFHVHMQHCLSCCAGELKIIEAILERPAIEKILTHLGLDPQPPPNAPARKSVEHQVG